MENDVSPRDFDLSALDPDARELLPLFISTRRADLAELQIALEQGALEVAARVGHRIKGTARSYGLAELGELANDMEHAANRRDDAEVERCAAGIGQWVAWLEALVGAANS
jgi:HPt (histidine-containing phosphotransfer) domain-containing protein